MQPPRCRIMCPRLGRACKQQLLNQWISTHNIFKHLVMRYIRLSINFEKMMCSLAALLRSQIKVIERMIVVSWQSKYRFVQCKIRRLWLLIVSLWRIIRDILRWLLIRGRRCIRIWNMQIFRIKKQQLTTKNLKII